MREARAGGHRNAAPRTAISRASGLRIERLDGVVAPAECPAVTSEVPAIVHVRPARAGDDCLLKTFERRAFPRNAATPHFGFSIGSSPTPTIALATKDCSAFLGAGDPYATTAIAPLAGCPDECLGDEGITRADDRPEAVATPAEPALPVS